MSTTLEVEIETEEEEEVEGKGPSTSTTLSTAFPSKTRLTFIRRTQPTRGLELETDDKRGAKIHSQASLCRIVCDAIACQHRLWLLCVLSLLVLFLLLLLVLFVGNTLHM